MATNKYLSGSIKLNFKRYAIMWVGQFAQHVAENYTKNDGVHNLLHVDIQRHLANCKKFFKKRGRKRTAAYGYFEDKPYCTIFEVQSGNAIIITNYLSDKQTMDNIKGLPKKKTLSRQRSDKAVKFAPTEQAIHLFMEGMECTYEEAKKDLTYLINS